MLQNLYFANLLESKMKNNFIYLAILSMVSVMYPWKFPWQTHDKWKTKSYKDCIAKCALAYNCYNVNPTYKPICIKNNCSGYCKDFHPDQSQ